MRSERARSARENCFPAFALYKRNAHTPARKIGVPLNFTRGYMHVPFARSLPDTKANKSELAAVIAFSAPFAPARRPTLFASVLVRPCAVRFAPSARRILPNGNLCRRLYRVRFRGVRAQLPFSGSAFRFRNISRGRYSLTHDFGGGIKTRNTTVATCAAQIHNDVA